jgi:L-amino acid N-acyltransferase YncA
MSPLGDKPATALSVCLCRPQPSQHEPAGIVVRRLRQSDADSVRAGFERLGQRTRQERWGHAVVRPDRELAWLDELTGSKHLAVGACDRGSGAPVGLARYVRSGTDAAEIALTVVDAWQRRGMGRALLEELCDQARANAVFTLRAAIRRENLPAMNLFASIGATRAEPSDHELLRYTLTLPASRCHGGPARRGRG